MNNLIYWYCFVWSLATGSSHQPNFYNNLSKLCLLLTDFMPLVPFYVPKKHKKSSGFLMISGGIKRDQWHEMG